MSVIRVNINGREVETTVGKSILDVAEENGIDIPHLCYDNRMEIYGGCGLCVVEIEGIPKLQRACATPVRDGMVVKTHTDRIVDTRKAALRLLVSDHRGDCRPPCVLACPAHTDCQGYVGLIANGQFDEALKLIKDKIPVPASIGRICPHPCEDACRRQLVEEPISIARLKAFAGDMDLAGEKYIPEIKENTGKKVAVVGAGPAGLSNAFFLRREGHDVTIYEAMPHGGGMLRYGIPEYRLPKEVLDKEISLIEKMGVKIVYNTKLGEDISLEYLKNNYDAVFIGIGAWKSSSIRCKGEDKKGVLGGIDFLREVSTNGKAEIGKRVAVVGGGNTAMDVARTAVRLGADKVSVLYRRTREEIPAEDIEIEEAEEEGVEFNYLVAPIEITGDDKVTGIRCQKMKLGEPDASGRRKPVPIEGEEIVFDVDTVIGAIGQQVTLGNIKGLNVTKKNTIQVKEGTYETNIPKVFAGGDVVSGPKIAIEAIAQGKEASIVMDSFLRGEIKPLEESYYVKQDDLTEKDFADRERIDRAISNVLSPEKRKNNFHSINETMTVEEAMKEGSRCLECGCKDYFECQLFKYINEYDIDPDKAHGEKHKRNNEDYHPFIERNPDKCILCSKCIRVCDDVVGVTALGLIDRGFNSIASPEFGLHLRDTECISCGQCVDACPVGAIIEKSAVKKQVPVDLKTTPSVCTFCGVGCNLNLESKGEYIYRTTPREDLEEGLLCMKGKFGVDHVNNKNRILEPTVYGEKVSKNLALNHVVKKLQSIRGMYGKDSIGVLVSPRFTTEELFVLKKIADKLGTSLTGSFVLEGGDGLKNLFGYNASANGYDEIYSTDLILSLGNIYENHPVMGMKMRRAYKKGKKIISVSKEGTRLDDIADISYSPEDNLNFLKGLIKVLIEQGYVNEKEIGEKSVGYEELKKWVKDASVDKNIEAIAKMYGEAKKAIIVVEEDTLTDEAVKLLGETAYLTGKIGKAHRGIIIMRVKNNSQGAWDVGFRTSGKEVAELIEKGQVKGLIVLGEDPVKADKKLKETFKKLEFLGVFDIFNTETAKEAEVVIPIGSSYESSGSFTRSDRRIQKVNPGIKPRIGESNLELFMDWADKLNIEYRDLEDIREDISHTIPEYSQLLSLEDQNRIYWSDKSVSKGLLYDNGFATEDKKAHLFSGKDGKMYREKKVYDTIDINLEEYAEREGIR